MPSEGLSFPCAQIFWTPSYCLVEYQCTFCQESFLNHYECMVHLKLCPENESNMFENFPAPTEFLSPKDLVHVKEEPELWQAEYLNSDECEFDFPPKSKRNKPEDHHTLAVATRELTEQNPLYENSLVSRSTKKHEQATLAKETFNPHFESGMVSNELVRSKREQQSSIRGQKQNTRSEVITHKNSKHKIEFKGVPGLYLWQTEFINLDEFELEFFPEDEDYLEDHQTSDVATRESIQQNMLYKSKSSSRPPRKTKRSTMAKENIYLPKDDSDKFSNELLCLQGKIHCDICGEKKTSRMGILTHMYSVHIADGSYTCFQCGMCAEKFPTEDKLNAHALRRHMMQFSCEYCGKPFRDKGNLRVHLRIHTGERPYRCKFCDKTFATTNVLLTHTRTHTGEKPYKCPMCPMACATATRLRLHVNSHTKEISYSCDLCDKTFTCQTSLKNHKRSHTGEQPYECNVCGRKFSRQQTYAMHMNTHTGNKPYHCKFCDRSFHSSAARCLHEQNFHKND